MRIITATFNEQIDLGKQGENLVTEVHFDVTGWAEEYGAGGVFSLSNRRNGDPAGYPVEITLEGDVVKWLVKAEDLAHAGCGVCELTYTVGEAVSKSVMFGTIVKPSLDGSGDPPDPWIPFWEQVKEARDEAVEAAGEAAQSERDAADSAGAASDSAEASSGSAASAEADALKAEGFAVGEQNGQPVESGSPYHENNAKYYKEQAAALAEEIEHSIDDIEALIPNQASPENQLADKNFVNSSIATNTANYISDDGQPFTSVAALEAYSGTVTNNDYAFVTGTDSAGNTYYDRYKATVVEGVVSWAKEYRLNNSSFTAAQWAAIESGITSTLVASYSAHLADTNNPHAVTKAQLGLGNVDNTSDANKPVSQAQAAALALKADKVADAVAGDFAALDANGNLSDSGISPSDLELVKDVQNDPANSSFDIAIQDAQPAPVLGAVLKGKTAAINQFVVDGSFTDAANWSVVNGSKSVTNGVLRATCTTAGQLTIKPFAQSVTRANHTYYQRVIARSSTTAHAARLSTVLTGPEPSTTSATFTALEMIGKRTSDYTGAFPQVIMQNASVGDYFEIMYMVNIDLTLCGFTAEETVNVATLKAAWLRKYGVPMPQYIPNNAGSILSNDATYQLCGRNIWDEEWELGAYDVNTGAPQSGSAVRSKSTNYIPIIGGETYYFKSSSYTIQVFWYDKNYNYIGVSATTDDTLDAPNNACYARFRMSSTYGNTYHNNICINESDPAFNGQYEPYYDGGSIVADSLNGFDGTNVFDTQSLAEKRRMCGKVDLGTLAWTYQSDYAYFEASINAGRFSDNILSAVYVYGGKNTTRSDMGSAPDMTMYSRNQGQTYLILFVKNTAYTDAATFKTAMSGQYLVFELATPTSETVTGSSLETKEGYNLLRPVSGDLQSGEVSMTYVKSSYLAKLIAWIRSIL